MIANSGALQNPDLSLILTGREDMADGALPKEGRRFTYGDYKSWELGPGERYEIIDGAAYAMSAPTDKHQAVLIALAANFYDFLKDKPCIVRPAPYDVRLFYEEDESDDTVVQPDLSILCDEKKRGEEGCRGVPDLVVEILSPSNTAIEMARKFELYRRAGVREYWVVNPEDRSVQAYRFYADHIKPHTYGVKDAARTDILPGLEIPLEPVFAEQRPVP
jgi:Uma2 family endonuclease